MSIMLAAVALELVARALDAQLLPDNARYQNRMHVPSSSSDSLYVVAQNKKSGRWECSCPGWIFHGHRDCKHLKAMKAVLESADLKQIEEAL